MMTTGETTARRRLGVLRDFGRLPRVMQLLVLTQLAFNIGFYMVLPYLATHLAEDLALAGALVGLVLGLRTFSQQGLFIVGGTLTDRFGAKPVVLTGCALRVAGFVLLGLAGSLPAVLAGAMLTGFAAALFSPAVESSLAREAGEHAGRGGPARADVFAMFAISGQVGTVVGPLVGTALLAAGFRLACLVAAAAFVLIGLAHLRWLPRREPQHADDPVLAGWTEVVHNRRFLAFAAGYSGYLLCYNQLYLALPAELRRATGDQAALGWLFALASVMMITGQLRTTRWSRRLGSARAIVLGFGLMTASFLAVALAVLAPATTAAMPLWPAVAMVALLTAGQMLAVPMAQDLVPRLAGERRLGVHYGVLSSAGGVAVLAGSTVVGALLDPAVAAPVVPWLVLAAVPAASAVVIGLLARCGALA
ncbi:MFS transporter [Pseudonocardia zijingensis]|jgi:MFS family permease|uniref:MFS transporter n=1 Tax=Pseudonocardia zijingensis TaxID=153376 RepID=A0ABN1N6M3_9PSEU